MISCANLLLSLLRLSTARPLKFDAAASSAMLTAMLITTGTVTLRLTIGV